MDVMLVGNDLSYNEIMQLLDSVEEQLQRPVNPTLYSPTEFAKRMAEGQNFLNKVIEQSALIYYIWVLDKCHQARDLAEYESHT